MQKDGHFSAERTHYFAVIDMQHWCAILDTKTTNWARLHSIEVLVSSNQNLHLFPWVLIRKGFNQFSSPILDSEQFVCCWRSKSAFSLVKKILTVWGNFARTTDPNSPIVKLTAKGNPARILPKWNHHVITASKSSLKNQLSQWKLHLCEEAHQSFIRSKLWVPVQTSLKYDHSLKPISKTAQKILRHEPHVREPDVAVCWPKLRQLELSRWLDELSPALDKTGSDLNFV